MQDIFIRADQHFSELVDLIDPEQWDKKSPVTPDWTVTQLVGHVTENNKAVCKAFGEDDTLATDIDASPIGAWQESANRAEAAARAVEDLDQVVSDDMTAKDFLTLMTTDRLVHSYDLAIAIGANSTLDPELVEIAYNFVAPRADDMQKMGGFAPIVEVPEDAPLQDKLLGLTGRTPR